MRGPGCYEAGSRSSARDRGRSIQPPLKSVLSFVILAGQAMNRYRGTQAEFQFSIVAPHTAHSKLLTSRYSAIRCGHKPHRTYRIDDQKILTRPPYARWTIRFPVNNPHNQTDPLAG
jgi:hypothetical protein